LYEIQLVGNWDWTRGHIPHNFFCINDVRLGQTEARGSSNNASDSKCAEESVIKILSDVDLAKASPQQVVEAMGCLSTQKKLGDKISNAAIPPLIDLLAFEPPSKNSPDEAASAPIRPRPFSSSYPAIETLFIIGNNRCHIWLKPSQSIVLRPKKVKTR
jgi:hypothetical protein